jgi:hypothetical protein
MNSKHITLLITIVETSIHMIYCLWYTFECTIPAKAIRTISEPLLVTWFFRVTTKRTRVWDSNIPKLLDILDIYDTEMLTVLFLLLREFYITGICSIMLVY